MLATNFSRCDARLCLAAWLLAGAVLLLSPSAAHAQQSKFTSVDGMEEDHFGSAVTISDDGQRAIAGAVFDDVAGNANQGSAYIFTRQLDDTFVQEAKLVASDGAPDDNLGARSAVSINADGTVALAGAFLDDVEGNANQGSAYIFTRDAAGVWTQEAKLLSNSGAADDHFGSSVSISDDGQRALVGAELDDGADGTTDKGAAYVFSRASDGTWTQEARLSSDALNGKTFPNAGDAVSMSGDGQRALVGAYLDDLSGNDSNEGSAAVFVRDASGNWTEEATLTATDAQPVDFFGNAVSLSDDGQRALVGAPLEDGSQGTNDQGAAYVFTRDGSTWAQTQKLATDDVVGSDNPNFGSAVSLSGDGLRALVGAFFDDPSGIDDAGSAYAFSRSESGSWTQLSRLTATNPEQFDNFGNAVSITEAGGEGLVGAFLEEAGGTFDQGSVFAFGSPPLPVELASFTARRDGEQAAVLSWRTFTETNNRGFEVQRSSTDTDGWQEVGFEASRAPGGTSAEALAYTHRVEALAYGRHTFRLVQQDFDGTPTELDEFTPSVEVTAAEGYRLTLLHANPLRGRGTIEVACEVTQDVTVALYDALGRQVRVLHEGVLAGGQPKRLVIEPKGLSSGVYFLRMRGEGFSTSREVVLVR